MKEFSSMRGLEAALSEIKPFAKTPSGKLVTRLYDQFRMKKMNI
jgi:hypothetical protein